MLNNSCAGIGICTTAERLFAKPVTVVRAAAIYFLVTILSHGSGASAAELKVFTSRAISTVLEIGPEFERTTGHKLNVISGFSPNFVKQINAGEPFDVVVSPPRTIDRLIKDGKVIAIRAPISYAPDLEWRCARAHPNLTSPRLRHSSVRWSMPNRSAISRVARYSNWSIGLELRMPSSRK